MDFPTWWTRPRTGAGARPLRAVYGAWGPWPLSSPPATAQRCTSPGKSCARSAVRPPSPREPDAQPKPRASVRGAANFNTLLRDYMPRDAGAGVQPFYKDGRNRAVHERCEQGESRRQASPGTATRVCTDAPSDRCLVEPALIFSQPDWISEPQGSDVLAGPGLVPFITLSGRSRRPSVDTELRTATVTGTATSSRRLERVVRPRGIVAGPVRPQGHHRPG